MHRNRHFFLALALISFWLFAFPRAAMSGGGELRLTVLDSKTGQPIACRMHLKTAAGKPRPQKPLPFWFDHFVLPGQIKLRLPRGQYTFEIERGPEYTDCTGYFTIDDHADDEKTVELSRAVDMAAEGWWSADLHVHRPLRDLKLLMEADDLHIAVNESSSAEAVAGQAGASPTLFGEDRFFYLEGREDKRVGNDLIYFARQGQVALPDSALSKLSPFEVLKTAKFDDSVWLDVAEPFSWDLPVLVALGMVDSIELANGHMCRRQTINSEGDARHRDVKELPAPFGNALWSQRIYYHLLNCGLRIPPTGGSGSGGAPNPVGYNRVYVYSGDKLDVDGWWQGFGRER